jgi:hypothetical protein
MRPYPALADDIEAGRSITREEAEAWVRQVDRRCMGPLVLSEEEIERYRLALQNESVPFADIAHQMVADENLVDKAAPYVGADAFLPGGLWETDPKAFVLRVLCASIGCGGDMNAPILEGPLDGVEREIVCHRCGRHHPCIPPRLNVGA